MWMIMSAIWNAFYQVILFIISIPRRILGLSLPAQIGLLVLLFLCVSVVIVSIAFMYNPELVSWRDSLTTGHVCTVFSLVAIIPLVVYKALKLWLEGEASRFPDIDYAWNAGVAELNKNGLPLTEVPLFLIIGSSGEQTERSLLSAARLSLRVRQTPQGPAAIHWYANPDGIYLVATEAGCLSRLATMAKNKPMESVSEDAPGVSTGPSIRGTIVLGQEPMPSSPMSGGGGGGANIRGTMVLGGVDVDGPAASPTAPLGNRAALSKNVSLTPQDAAEARLRLQYLAQLIRRARAPLCGVNGMLALLPFDLIAYGPRDGVEMQRALKSDLDILVSTLQVRCPVTAVVVGMEAEPGFVELVHRVGHDRSIAQRFGKGFNVWTDPDPEQLEALSIHACGAFEDWVYTLFRERGSLARPGNTKLYAMLCKIRRDLQTRLTSIITGGFGRDERDLHGDTLLFSGCYFAATGDNEDQQAFVKGVFDKLPEGQEDLEWTRQAFRTQQRYKTLSYVGLFVDFLLIATLVGMIVYQFFLKKA